MRLDEIAHWSPGEHCLQFRSANVTLNDARPRLAVTVGGRSETRFLSLLRCRAGTSLAFSTPICWHFERSEFSRKKYCIEPREKKLHLIESQAVRRHTHPHTHSAHTHITCGVCSRRADSAVCSRFSASRAPSPLCTGQCVCVRRKERRKSAPRVLDLCQVLTSSSSEQTPGGTLPIFCAS